MYFVFAAGDGNLSTTVTNYMFPCGGSTGTGSTEAAMQGTITEACDLKNLYIQLEVAPGTGKSRTFTVRKNGADTALTCTIADTSTSAEDTTNVVSFAAGDLISISTVPTGTPAANTRYQSRILGNTTASQSQIIMGGSFGSGTPSQSATSYINPFTTFAGGATEVFNEFIVPAAGTISKLYFKIGTAPGGTAQYVFTARKNGANTALTTTLAGVSTTANDTAHSFTVAAGDIISIQSVPTNTPAGGSSYSLSLSFTPTTPGDSIYGGSFASPSTSAVNYFTMFNNAETIQTTEVTSIMVAPGPLMLKNLYVNITTAPGGAASWTFRVRQNSADTGMAVAISSASTSGNSGSTAPVQLQKGDKINLSVTPASTPASTANINMGFALNFPSTGFLPMLM